MKDINIFYLNVRGLKSKLKSLHEIIEDLCPDVIALVETMLDESDSVILDGYSVTRRDRKGGHGGGVMFAVNYELSGIVVDERISEITESMWMRIYTGREDIRMGVIYNPQECRTPKIELKKIYDEIEDEVKMANMMNQKLILVGDLNCKVGSLVSGNNSEVTVGGKMLINIVKRQELMLVNNSERTSGKWTREEGNAKSIIDYVLIKQEDEDDVTEMKIDEEKHLAPMRIVKVDGECKAVYSDHNVIWLRMNCLYDVKSHSKAEHEKKYMTNKSYERYRREIEEKNISTIWSEDASLQECYDRWTSEVFAIKKRHEVKRRRNRGSKTKRVLRRCIRDIKKSNEHRDIAETRIKLLAETIIEEEKSLFGKRIRATVEDLKKKDGILDQGAFWKFKKKIEGTKVEEKKAMRNSEGTRVEDEGEILQVYEKFYLDLLQTPRPENETERQMEEEVEATFERICFISENQGPMEVDENNIRNVRKKLKRRKAGDREGWNNEMILEAGEEMVKSLKIMFNRILKEHSIPRQWTEMTIKSIHKKGSKMLMENRRGLFLTSIISKVFERVLDEITQGDVEFNEYQCGGRKGRGTIDNQIMMLAIRDNNMRLNKKTYVYFADAYKCFDRLWLKDCLVELWKAGMREREVMMIYEMNKLAKIVINTPIGNTKEIEVSDIVRQGTIFGPKLCCISTQKVNNLVIPHLT